MSGGKNSGAGIMALGTGGLAMLLALLVLIGSTADEDTADNIDGAASSEALNAHEVPAEYLGWVSRAGAVCPDVSAPLIAAQIEAESGWNPRAVSPVGAQGLSQFMPGTWHSWGVDAAGPDGTPHPDGRADPWTPGDAIMTQARYDCWLARKVRSYHVAGDTVPLMLAAYNAGPDAIRQHGGFPPYLETNLYVQRILKLRNKYRETSGGEDQATTFGARVAAYGRKWIGTPYSWGGGTVDGPGGGAPVKGGGPGFDCSGLVQYAVYQASHGELTLPRVSQQQATAGKPVSPSSIAVGDVIAFALHGAGNWDHIGIYVGNGQFVHAPKTGDFVKISSLSEDFYRDKPKTIRRMG